jgi:hypothetical protein
MRYCGSLELVALFRSVVSHHGALDVLVLLDLSVYLGQSFL